jgi:hypothetical protein
LRDPATHYLKSDGILLRKRRSFLEGEAVKMTRLGGNQDNKTNYGKRSLNSAKYNIAPRLSNQWSLIQFPKTKLESRFGIKSAELNLQFC